MSESVEAATPTAGELLREAREAAGLHVAALAVSLKVPVRKLEALEDDRYDQLPDAVFARALASSVCRTLKVDPQPILARLPQSAVPRLVQSSEGINAPFQAPGDAVAPAWRDHATRPVTLAVGALLVGALVIMFLPSLSNLRADATTPKVTESAAVPMAAAVVVQPATDGPATPGAVVSEPVAVPAMTTPDVAQPAPVAAPAAVNAAASAPAPAATASAPAAKTEPPVSTTGIIVFKTTGPSWIQVTDSKGTVTLQRLMTAGETAGASGAPPLAVTVGDAKATAVSVRGKAYDLGPVSRDNVARFEVK
ncbi:helix-turn-helix domain-containing protein [Ramlibacter humi]|uniref:Helix-turn-helix domain-containing protein n=1 Tax=Ramlibacter humi TaxID=2530451 RepID=A0A4Z0CDD1_9BURK|nr:helix-turn-helix domain-containing protein [Ramlibacter humi]TFZ08470.1 helix-turn-helix domain-containing protein [Ramlibacter humi]